MNFQASQQNFKVSSEESRITPLGDDIVAFAISHFLFGDFRARITLKAVDVLISVQLSTEIDQIGPVDLLEAISHSCNVYFYQLGLRVGLQRLLEEGTRIGFNQSLARSSFNSQSVSLVRVGRNGLDDVE